MFLQSYVLAVCSYEVVGESAYVRHVHGTGFLINENGVFLTARHVLEGAIARANQESLAVGLVVKQDNGSLPNSSLARVLQFAFAPPPFDIAIGSIAYQGPTLLKLSDRPIDVWQDIATFGYPENAISGDPTALRINLRAHKGYIQRILAPGDIPIGRHPPGFELSFVLSAGLSGAPLFVHQHAQDHVIGVCVGSFKNETVEDSFEEIEVNGEIKRGKILRVDQYGLAHDIRGILDWRPDGFKNESLAQIGKC